MDTQAKDRLTGAVILVALVVLLVPELLSGPGAKRANVASVAEGQPLRSYTVELGDEARAHGAAASAASAALVAPPAAPAAHSPPPPEPVAEDSVAAAPPAPAAPESHAVATSHPQTASASAPVTGWIIQLGSFASRVNAERLVHELKSKGYAASMTESANGGRKLYRVRVGPTADHATAQALAAKLRAAGHPGSLAPHP